MKALKSILVTPISSKRQWLARSGFLVMFVAVTIGLLAANSVTRNGRRYQAAVNQLASEAKKIDGALVVPEPNAISQDLNDYTARLDSMEESCHSLGELTPLESGSKTKQREQVAAICKDLTGIVKYSRSLYHSLRPYLLLDDSPWPKPDTPEYSRLLDEVVNIIDQTELNLKTVDNSELQDPAFEELQSQVNDAKAAVTRLKQAESGATTKLTEDLRRQLLKDKTDFLAARTYFWKNTVGIAKLREALADIQSKQ